MGNKGIGIFVVGGLLGAGVALLYAPRAGAETRALVSDKVNVVWGEAQELGSKAGAKGQQIYQEASSRGQEIYSGATARVQEAAENIKPVFAEKNDELREKIEAARQRIATQVAQNAETAHAVAHEKIPVAAEAAEAAVSRVYDAATAAVEKIAGEAAVTPSAVIEGALTPEPAEKPAE
ncbi:MAG: YtxH domain-containing protein [Raoultibacter sp.]